MPYNPGLLYYRHYFDGIDFSQADEESDKKRRERRNGGIFYNNHKKLYSFTYPGSAPFIYPDFGATTFELTTASPGLLLGSGYEHGSGLLGELKIGFYFDHTTGLPVIPGSSVKGVLRSAFPGQYRKAALKHRSKAAAMNNAEARDAEIRFAEQLDHKAGLCELFIRQLLLKILPDTTTPAEIDSASIEQIENEIFGRTDAKDNGLPMSGRDIFHDAVPIRSAVQERLMRLEKVGESDEERKARATRMESLPAGTLFADDFITPHKNRTNDGFPDSVKNPVPVGFLKVLPGVTFRFQFDLKNSLSPAGINAAQKLAMFKAILIFRGVGAKTNTGYGLFVDPQAQTSVASGASSNRQANSGHTVKEEVQERDKPKSNKPLRKGEVVEAVVIEHPATPAGHIALKLFAGEPEKEPVVFYRFPAGRAPGTTAKAVRIEDLKPSIRISIIQW